MPVDELSKRLRNPKTIPPSSSPIEDEVPEHVPATQSSRDQAYYTYHLTLAQDSDAHDEGSPETSIEQSPLYSAKTFEELGLPAALQRGIQAMGFVRPSRIQERALPLLLQNPPRNMIGQSQAGSGKTAAFVLNMLSRIDHEVQAPQAIALFRTLLLSLPSSFVPVQWD